MPEHDDTIMALLLFLFSHFLLGCARGQATCQPRWPTLIPPAPDRNTGQQQMAGDWYKYRQQAQINGLQFTINQRIRWTSVAQTVDTLTNTPAVAMTAQFAQYNFPDGRKCANHFWSGLYSEDGRIIGNVAVTEDNLVMRQENYAILYHDYDKMVAGYTCYGVNPDGTCQTPGIWAQTRVIPTNLTASDKAAFDAILDRILAPYCVKAADIPLQTYNDQPFCPFLDFPDCSARLMRGLQLLDASIAPVGNAAGTPAPFPCQLPNSINRTMSFDPTQMAGAWHGYRSNSAKSNIAYSRWNWHVINKSTFPVSDMTAQLMWLEYATISNNVCMHGYYLGEVGVNGQADGLFGPISPAGDRVHFQLTTLYLDSHYAFYYGCLVPDPTSANCRFPYVSAVTRLDPSQLTASDKTSFDTIITSFLSPYGCTANDVALVQQTAGDPACQLTGTGDQCILQNIKGLTEAVDTTSTMPGSPAPFPCQLPNSINPTMTFDPTQMAGAWYGYRFDSAKNNIAYSRWNWHVIGKSTFPVSNMTAQLMWLEYATISNNVCMHGYYLGEVGVNGQGDGLFRPITPAGDRVFFQLTTLYLDSHYAFYYGCLVPDPASATCRFPYVSAVTRLDPSQLTASDKTSFDTIITSFLSPYGCTANDVALVQETAGDPACQLNGTGDLGIQQNIEGLTEAHDSAMTKAQPYSY